MNLLMLDNNIDGNTVTIAVVSINGAMFVLFIVAMILIIKHKEIRRWWRKRKLKLNVPGEDDVRTITGPTWRIEWTKVSQIGEKYPDRMSTTVLGNTLPEVFQVLKAKFGDEFEEANVRGTSFGSEYSTVLVGIPDKVG